MQWKYLLKLISVPLSLLAFYSLYFFLWKIFGLPSNEELIQIVREAFARHGLIIVFACSLIEGLLLAGNYFPGGLVIFLGVITAGKDILRVVAVVAVVSLAFFMAYTLNYFLGRYGWYKLLVRFGLTAELEKAKARLEKHGSSAIMLSYWQPNLAALTATATGVLKLPIKKFLPSSLAGIVIWNTFWGGLVYALEEQALQVVTNFKYVLVAVLIWVILIFVKEHLAHKKQNQETQT